jgi:tetratricopeptide (TPR) repeat protein
MKQVIFAFAIIPSVFGLLACSRGNSAAATTMSPACSIALASQAGRHSSSGITRLQQEARSTANPRHVLEQLGWTLVDASRHTNDPGYYKLAEQTALCLEAKYPGSPEGLLLRGHVLHSQHRFREAEEVAQKLIKVRKAPFDYGLLGDVLMEQGRLRDAVAAYQNMLDLKPNLQSYSRAAHIRWLKGDLAGARVLIQMAASAGSSQEAEPTAWAYTRMALYELQAGSRATARAATHAALALEPDYAPALLSRGRLLLDDGNTVEAIESLQRAAKLNPLPEYHWVLAEALHAAGRNDEAAPVEKQILERGASDDPRTFALYLATRKEQVATAVKLANDELANRADVFTLDALAWALSASGRVEEAYSTMKKALAEGTQDARLFYHAGIIFEDVGQKEEGKRWLTKAAGIRQMLLPSERDRLTRHIKIPY